MEVTGKILKIGKEQVISDKFKKREIVIQTEEQYPQSILIEFTQDKTTNLNGFEVGQNVVIGINLRGREWTDKNGEVRYFNSIQGWKINGKGLDDVEQTQPSGQVKDKEDDLPF